MKPNNRNQLKLNNHEIQQRKIISQRLQNMF